MVRRGSREYLETMSTSHHDRQASKEPAILGPIEFLLGSAHQRT